MTTTTAVPPCSIPSTPESWKPPSSATASSPTHSAIPAASRTRRSVGARIAAAYRIVRAMTTRWISFVPS